MFTNKAYKKYDRMHADKAYKIGPNAYQQNL